MRMKNRILTGLLILLLSALLSACGSSMNSGTGSEDSGSTSRETEETGAENQAVIYEKDNLTLKLSQEYFPTETNRSCYLIAEYSGKGSRSCEISDVVVNGTLKAQNVHDIVDDTEPVSYTSLDSLARDMQTEGMKDWESISFHLSVQDENYENVEETDLTVDLSGKLEYAAYGNRPLSSLIEGQVLIDTEELRVTAVYFGNPPSDDSNTYLILKAENLSDGTIPVELQEISVNHMTVNSSTSEAAIPAGKTAYLEGIIYGSGLEELGITEYQELRLLISTSRSEENGGGVWYELDLDHADAEEEWNQEDYVLIDSFEDVSVYYQKDGFTADVLSFGPSAYSFTYEWNLLIVNNGNENVELAVDDGTRDGSSFNEIYPYTLLRKDSVGAGDKVQTSLVHSMDTASYISELSFSLRYFKNGREELLHRSETITLSTELKAIDTSEEVRIYPLEWDWTYENDQTLDVCYFLAVNETDQEVNVELAGLRRGDREYMKESEDGTDYLKNGTIPPNSSQLITLQFPEVSAEEEDADTEVKFIYSSDGKILYESKDYETIYKE